MDDGIAVYSTAHELRKSKGVHPTDTCFRIGCNILRDIPIYYHITDKNFYHYYRTVNGCLESKDDQPAYISFNRYKKWIARKWFQNNVLHRNEGPAEETLRGYEIDENFTETHIREEWSDMSMKWWYHGMDVMAMTRVPEDFPMNRQLIGSSVDGWRYKRKKSGLLDSITDTNACFFSGSFRLSWGLMADGVDKQFEGLGPITLFANNLQERYNNGKLADRRCDSLNIVWCRNGTVVGGEPVAKFNEYIRKRMFNDLNILTGDFYEDPELEFLILAEFDRLYEKN